MPRAAPHICRPDSSCRILRDAPLFLKTSPLIAQSARSHKLVADDSMQHEIDVCFPVWAFASGEP